MKDYDDNRTPLWMYAQEKNKQKKESKQWRNMRQNKKDNWNNMESV